MAEDWSWKAGQYNSVARRREPQMVESTATRRYFENVTKTPRFTHYAGTTYAVRFRRRRNAARRSRGTSGGARPRSQFASQFAPTDFAKTDIFSK
jgi:hypothetical protein